MGRDDALAKIGKAREGFNPRARVGRDRLLRCNSFLPDQFQSTRPRGARHYSGDKPKYIFKFQSTRPRGARQEIQSHLVEAGCVSIHAPAWGATLMDDMALQVRNRFNPRARVGRDVRAA